MIIWRFLKWGSISKNPAALMYGDAQEGAAIFLKPPHPKYDTIQKHVKGCSDQLGYLFVGISIMKDLLVLFWIYIRCQWLLELPSIDKRVRVEHARGGRLKTTTYLDPKSG